MGQASVVSPWVWEPGGSIRCLTMGVGAGRQALWAITLFVSFPPEHRHTGCLLMEFISQCEGVLPEDVTVPPHPEDKAGPPHDATTCQSPWIPETQVSAQTHSHGDLLASVLNSES